MKKTVIELFAGVGGFRVGLEKSGKWDTLWANQWEPGKKLQHAFECYKSNFEGKGGINEFSNCDISKVDIKDIPKSTLLVGGFPCQDYSVAGTQTKGIHGKKGVLWWEIIRIVKAKKPPFLLLENVDRLLRSPVSKRGRDFGIMLATLSELGYAVEWRVINAADYGFQQRRRRVFIFAANKKTNYYKSLSKDKSELIQKKGFFASIFPIRLESPLVESSSILSSDIKEISDNFAFHFYNSGIMINNDVYTIKTVASKKIVELRTLGSVLEDGDIDKSLFLDREDLKNFEYMKGSKKKERTSKTGFTYTFAEGSVPFPDLLDRPARTMLTSESSSNRSTHIVKDKKTKKLRKLTPIECERINGFEDDWTDTGMPKNFRYFCMGNALVVDLIEHMGKKISKIVDAEN